MDCTLCTLPSLIFSKRDSGSIVQQESSDKETNTRRNHSSIREQASKLEHKEYAKRIVSETIRNQLQIAIQKQSPTLSADDLRHVKHFLIFNSAQDFSPALAAFDGLGSPPFLLYVVPTYDKLYVMDLGLIRMFFDVANTVIQRNLLFHRRG